MMSHPKLAKHLTLLRSFTFENAKESVLIKWSYWETCGYCPWALSHQNKLIDWGRVSAELRSSWISSWSPSKLEGWGKKCLQKYIEHNSHSHLKQEIAILPDSRKYLKGIEQLGLHQKNIIFIDGNRFFQFFKRPKDQSLIQFFSENRVVA